MFNRFDQSIVFVIQQQAPLLVQQMPTVANQVLSNVNVRQ